MDLYLIFYINQSKKINNSFVIFNRKVIKPIQSLNIIKQIANVCLFLHKSKVCHRDLKSLNILFDEFYRVKLCDFGLARNFVINKYFVLKK